MSKTEALVQLRTHHDLLTTKLVQLRELQEVLRSNIDTALNSQVEVERYLTIHEKAKE